jgi:hypothetical protein
MNHNTDHNTEHIPPEDAPTDEPPSRWRKAGLVAAGLAFTVPIVGLTTYGIAGADSAEDSPEDVVTGCVPPTPEDIAASNEDEDALAAFLDERGIHYTREPDADGINWVLWDMNDGQAEDAVEEFYAERYPLSPEDREAANAEQDALAAFFDERGIRYTRDTGADGVDYVVSDENDEATSEATADFFAERYPTPEELQAELGLEFESSSCVGMVEVEPG